MGEPSGRVHGLLRRLCLEARLTQEELAEAAWLSDSVRVSIARHRVMDTTGICQGPGAGQRGLLTEFDARRCLHLRPTADQGTARVTGQGNRPGM